jgi:hypothetical protein
LTLDEFEKTENGKWFFSKVEKTNGCWLWTAGQMFGYGCLRDPELGKNRRAHQFIMRILKGLPKNGLEVCHKCNIKLCVNPEHLYYGTRRDNIADQVDAGVHNFLGHDRIGVKSPRAILTEIQVLEIRSLGSLGLEYKEILRKMNLNVSVETIGNVIRKSRYSSVK